MVVEDPVVSRDSLRIAYRRLSDFYAVQKGGDRNALIEAVATLRKRYGLTDDLMNDFVEWMSDFSGDEHQGALMLGLLVGVMAAEIQHEGW